MYWFKALLATWVCLAELSVAQAVAFTEWPAHLTHGESATVKWQGEPDTPVTIYLRKGAANNLGHVQVLTTNGRGGSFTFVPDDSLPDGSDYALQIQQNGRENYSGLLTLGSPDAKKPTPPTPTTQDAKPQTPANPSPHEDVWPTEVAKGNNAQFASVDDMSKGSTDFTYGTAMAAKMETNDAPVGNIRLGWALASVGALFYLTQ